MVQPIMTRLVPVTTEHTGGTLDLTGLEGVAQFRRIDPHGVVMMFGGQQLSIPADVLPLVGRFFLAAAMVLGQDVTAGWDAEQEVSG
jgi:hypothetical protein